MKCGIAPSADIVNIKVLNDTGSGTDSTVTAGIQTAIQLRSKYNIRVMNLSLGRPITSSYLTASSSASMACVVVAAGNEGCDNFAGNNGYGTITAPGNSPYVITVGAMNTVGTETPAGHSCESSWMKAWQIIRRSREPSG